MIEAPLAVAFAAGLIAIMNPCGFAMLPAYLSYFMGIGQDEAVGRAQSLRRALVVGGVMSLSFLLIFGATGVVITAGFRAVIDWIPYVALGIGAFVALLGLAMLFGYELTLGLPKAKTARKDNGLRSVFVFGLSYGAASLSCTLPVFLSVVAAQLTASNFATGTATFLVYGLGMSMMLIAITIILAMGKQTIVGRLRSSVRYINRVSGAVLVVAGAYIVWFWVTNLGQGAEALNNSGAFRLTETLSQKAAETFGENALLWAVIFAGLITTAVAYAFRPTPGVAGRIGRRRRLLTATSAAGLIAAVAGVGFFAVSPFTGSDSRPVAAAASGVTQGPAAPSATFALFDDSTTTLATYHGQPLVVNFWASWCPSCVAELSEAIAPVQAQFGADVAWLGVNLQDERSEALRLIEETGVQFDLAEDPDGELYREFGGFSMPFTAFISADGVIIEEHNGPLTQDQLEEMIEELFLAGDALATDGS